MTTLVQPKTSVRFTLPNGVFLRADAHVRMIKSSSRVDAKSIGIDWKTIYVGIMLDSEECSPRIVNYINMCSEDAEQYINEKLMPVAMAMGSVDYFHVMQNAMFLAFHNVKQLRKD